MIEVRPRLVPDRNGVIPLFRVQRHRQYPIEAPDRQAPYEGNRDDKKYPSSEGKHVTSRFHGDPHELFLRSVSQRESPIRMQIRMNANMARTRASAPCRSGFDKTSGIQPLRLAPQNARKTAIRQVDPWWVLALFPGPEPRAPIRVAVTRNPGGEGVHPSVAEGVDKAARALGVPPRTETSFNRPSCRSQ